MLGDVRSGEFGLWEETGWINEAIVKGYRDGMGYGEAVGRMSATWGRGPAGMGTRATAAALDRATEQAAGAGVPELPAIVTPDGRVWTGRTCAADAARSGGRAA